MERGQPIHDIVRGVLVAPLRRQRVEAGGEGSDVVSRVFAKDRLGLRLGLRMAEERRQPVHRLRRLGEAVLVEEADMLKMLAGAEQGGEVARSVVADAREFGAVLAEPLQERDDRIARVAIGQHGLDLGQLEHTQQQAFDIVRPQHRVVACGGPGIEEILVGFGAVGLVRDTRGGENVAHDVVQPRRAAALHAQTENDHRWIHSAATGHPSTGALQAHRWWRSSRRVKHGLSERISGVFLAYKC